MIPREVEPSASRRLYLATEARWVRCACLIVPVCLLISLPCLRVGAACLLNLAPPEKLWVWRDALDVRVLCGAALVSVAPLLWLVLIKMEQRLSGGLVRGRWPIAFVLAGLGIVVTCVGLRQKEIRWSLLEAGKVRFEKFSFASSITFWQRHAMDYVPKSETPDIMLVGSSQMNFAVDLDEIAAELSGARAHKRCLPGFGIMQYLMIAPELIMQQADVVVCWISEFDTFREDSVPADRLRCFSRLPQVWRLCETLGAKQAWRNRSELADLALAGIVQIWGDRELLHRLLFQLWWRACANETLKSSDSTAGTVVTRQRENIRRSIRRTSLLDANFRSFRCFAKMMRSANIQLCVFEGSTSPRAMSVYDPSFRFETRGRLRRMASNVGFLYIDETEMPRFAPEDFCDLYHLTPLAGSRFSRFLADRMREDLGI